MHRKVRISLVNMKTCFSFDSESQPVLQGGVYFN